MFRGAKDRVNRMGGVGAWRERSRKQKPGGWDDEDGSRDVNLEKLTQEQREQLEMQREELEAERKRYGESDERARKEDVEERDDDVSFSFLTSFGNI